MLAYYRIALFLKVKKIVIFFWKKDTNQTIFKMSFSIKIISESEVHLG